MKPETTSLPPPLAGEGARLSGAPANWDLGWPGNLGVMPPGAEAV